MQKLMDIKGEFQLFKKRKGFELKNVLGELNKGKKGQQDSSGLGV